MNCSLRFKGAGILLRSQQQQQNEKPVQGFELQLTVETLSQLKLHPLLITESCVRFSELPSAERWTQHRPGRPWKQAESWFTQQEHGQE